MKSSLLFSGGLDSVVLAHMAAAAGDLDSLILFDYGHAAAARQRAISQRVAWRLKVPLIVQQFDYKAVMQPDQVRANPLFDPDFRPSRPTSREDVNSASYSMAEDHDFGFLHGRNALFILQASIVAAMRGCRTLHIGFQANEYELDYSCSPTPPKGADTTYKLIEAMRPVIWQSFGVSFALSAPLMFMDKQQIVNLGRSLGVKFEDTVQCEYAEPCGRCSQCIERQNLGV